MAGCGKPSGMYTERTYLLHLLRNNSVVANSNAEAANRIIIARVFELARNSVIEYPTIGTIAIAKLIIRGRT
jgi:hypothetical protein